MAKIVNGNRIRRDKVIKLVTSQDEMMLRDILSGKFTKPIPKFIPKMKVPKPGLRRERIIKVTRVVEYPSLLKIYADAFAKLFS